MSIVATGALARAYIEIADREADSNRIARVVLYLIGVGWFDLTDVFPSGQDGFCLPEPIGCNCTITDVSDRGWSNVKYEIEYASSYSRDGVFWSMGCRAITKQQFPSLIEQDA